VPAVPRWATFLVASLLAGCGAASPRGSATPAPIQSAAVASVPAPAASSATAASAPADARAAVSNPAGAPNGYVEMMVGDVTPTPDGNAVLLIDESSDVVVPIFIGPSEATAIDLRQRKQRYQRPLTHDLLDAIMHELGGSLVKVQIDDIKDNTFVGAVFVRTATRVVELDARPSDAIALALGSHVPIFVARRVIERAGVHGEDRSAPSAPGDRSRL
jgi:bifunctional DNase/RNase